MQKKSKWKNRFYYCLLVVVLLLAQFAGIDSEMTKQERTKKKTGILFNAWFKKIMNPTYYTLHRNDIIPCIRASHYKHNLIEVGRWNRCADRNIDCRFSFVFELSNVNLLKDLEKQATCIHDVYVAIVTNSLPIIIVNCNWCNTECRRFSMINMNIVYEWQSPTIPVIELNDSHFNKMSLGVWHNIIIDDGLTEPCVCKILFSIHRYEDCAYCAYAWHNPWHKRQNSCPTWQWQCYPPTKNSQNAKNNFFFLVY